MKTYGETEVLLYTKTGFFFKLPTLYHQPPPQQRPTSTSWMGGCVSLWASLEVSEER